MITKVKQTTLDILSTLGYLPITDAIVGCIGDGVFDNTAKLLAAFSLGVPLLIPTGTFLCGNLVIPTGTIIFGTGNKSILKLKTGANSVFINVSGSSNFQNFEIDANKAGQLGSGYHGVVITNSTGTEFKNVRVMNSLADCFNVTGAGTTGLSLVDCKVSGATKNGCTIENGSDIRIHNLECFTSDVVASPGDGISLAPVLVGALISNVSITNCGVKTNIGRGISCIGFGGRNVQDISLVGNRISGNSSHGIHIFGAQAITASNNIIKGNVGDGIRLEGDTQSCRITTNITDTNAGFAIREVTTGSSPNLNGLIYNVALGNGTNTITKIGAGSFIV